MPSMDVSFRLVTPAYAGGADTNHTDGLRPPTLKALLRFWWRAMHPALPPGQLFSAEERIFGSTKAGQGLRVVPCGPWRNPKHDQVGSLANDPLSIYFAYGPVAWDRNSLADPQRDRGASVLKTPRIHVHESVKVKLKWNPSLPIIQDEIFKTLWLVSAFGTIGSRARRGWGSLRLEGGFGPRLKDPHVASSVIELGEIISNGLREIIGPQVSMTASSPKTPLHTAFSASSRIALGPISQTWQQALTSAKDMFYLYHRALGAERNHAPGKVGPDHKKRAGWLKTPPTTSDTTPMGSAFGLPHNAQFSPPGKGPKVEVGVGPDLSGRRASPVIFKVLQCGESFAPLVLWLPSLFLPNDQAIYVRGDGIPPTKVDYSGEGGISDFFDGNNSLNFYDKRGKASPWKGLTNSNWKEVVW